MFRPRGAPDRRRDIPAGSFRIGFLHRATEVRLEGLHGPGRDAPPGPRPHGGRATLGSHPPWPAEVGLGQGISVTPPEPAREGCGRFVVVVPENVRESAGGRPRARESCPLSNRVVIGGADLLQGWPPTLTDQRSRFEACRVLAADPLFRAGLPGVRDAAALIHSARIILSGRFDRLKPAVVAHDPAQQG